MKKYMLPLLLLSCTYISCNTWPQEDKDAYTQSCLQDANTWAGSPDKAKTYCDCMLQQLMKKYPNANDMMEHIDSVMKDTSLMNCKDRIK